MQQETETSQQDDAVDHAQGPRLLDELKGFAAEHRALWQKNYRAFTDEYGNPRDRLTAMRDRMADVLTRLREQARVGYQKVDEEIARKTSDAEVRVNGGSTNGHQPEAESPKA